MRVLIVLTGGISTDGITSSWLSICREWKYQGSISFEFLCIEDLSNADIISQFEKLGFRLHFVKSRGGDLFRYIKSLSTILKSNSFDAIHVNGSSSLMAVELFIAQLQGIRHRIVHSHNTTTSNPIIHRFLNPVFQKLTTMRIACSELAGKWLFGKHPFVNFHNGINLRRFSFDELKRSAKRTELGIQENVLAIGHVGKFNTQKNHKYLIEVFKEILNLNSNSHLYLYGDGPLEQDTSSHVKELQLERNVHFMGCTTEIENNLQAMDLMLLPSLHEGLPNVVIEWQASGLPSIVADTITEETNVTDLVKFMPLESSFCDWAKASLAESKKYNHRVRQSTTAINELRINGFDIYHQVEKLKEIYSIL